MTFDAKEEDGAVWLLLPETDDLDKVLAVDKWMIKKATSEAYAKGSAGTLEIIGPSGMSGPMGKLGDGKGGVLEACGGKIEW